MRIDVLAIGSRGDVQPYIALSIGLREAGHRVRIVTLGGFEDLIQPHGLDHLAIGGRPLDIANTDAGREWVGRRTTAMGFLKGFVRVAGSLIEEGIATYWRDCGDVEALVVSGMGILLGVHIAERVNALLIRVETSPFARTQYDWAGKRNSTTILRGEWTALQHAVFRTVMWSMLRRNTNVARKGILGLPALPLMEPFKRLDRRRLPVLEAYSSAVVPRPPDWGEWIHVTGYWFLEDSSEWTPPGELVDFLESGAPPVFVGFGSTPFPQPEVSTRLVMRALERAGKRGVVLAGGSGLAIGRLSDSVISLNSVPHKWLFSHVCAAVHHGGAGVTGAALRAGLPSAVVPVFADQPFWASRVYDLGAGPRPIPAKRLSEASLTAAIQATSDKEIRSRAAELGRRIDQESGVARAVDLIQQSVANSARM